MQRPNNHEEYGLLFPIQLWYQYLKDTSNYSSGGRWITQQNSMILEVLDIIERYMLSLGPYACTAVILNSVQSEEDPDLSARRASFVIYACETEYIQHLELDGDIMTKTDPLRTERHLGYLSHCKWRKSSLNRASR